MAKETNIPNDYLRIYDLRPNALRVYLAMFFLGFVPPIVLIDFVIQPIMLYREQIHVAGAYELWLLHHLCNYVGNYTAALAVPLTTILTTGALQKIKMAINRESLQRKIDTLQTLLPFFLVTLFLVIMIDNEVPGGIMHWGEEYAQDIPAGLIGLIGMTVWLEEYYRTMQGPGLEKPVWEPVEPTP